MKVAILGCENSHAWTFAEHIKENERYKDIELIGIFGYDDVGAQKIVEKAIRGMLPKGKNGDDMYRRLYVYVGPNHPHAAQKPEALPRVK